MPRYSEGIETSHACTMRFLRKVGMPRYSEGIETPLRVFELVAGFTGRNAPIFRGD